MLLTKVALPFKKRKEIWKERIKASGFKCLNIIKTDTLLLETSVTKMEREKQEAKEKERENENVCWFI